jgi:branched-chain amino acid transport system substrate-binding protein
MRRVIIVALGVILAGGFAFPGAERAVVIGAVYPTGGSQGPGGREEFRGVSLASEYVDRSGGVRGRPIRLLLEPANSYDAAPGAVERLAASGAPVIVGSYGSTISLPAAATASRLGLVFWETGAVGQLTMVESTGTRIFRVAPTGAALGRAAVDFVRDELASRVRSTPPVRYSVVYVDDVYGRSVGLGAVEEIRRSHLRLAAALPYDLAHVNYERLAHEIADAKTDVLVVASYLQDAVAMRRAIVDARVPLLASIGTSSSYCMPAFGLALGQQAVGLFASDKPDGDVLRSDRLSPEAARELHWARTEYRRRYGGDFSAAALAGFAGGIALFRYVLPLPPTLSSDGVAQAARQVRLPRGALPNGSGLAFAPPTSPDAGANMEAMSVIWEWIRPHTRAVVWPPEFATHPIVFP